MPAGKISDDTERYRLHKDCVEAAAQASADFGQVAREKTASEILDLMLRSAPDAGRWTRFRAQYMRN